LKHFWWSALKLDTFKNSNVCLLPLSKGVLILDLTVESRHTCHSPALMTCKIAQPTICRNIWRLNHLFQALKYTSHKVSFYWRFFGPRCMDHLIFLNIWEYMKGKRSDHFNGSSITVINKSAFNAESSNKRKEELKWKWPNRLTGRLYFQYLELKLLR